MLSSPTVIPAHTTIEGRIETSADLVIEGSCNGEIEVDGALSVGAGSSCRANIRARVGTILGEVIGNITCSDSVALGEGARVVGDLRAPEISIHPRAEVDGRVDMLAPEPDQIAPLRAPVRVRRAPGLTRPAPPHGE